MPAEFSETRWMESFWAFCIIDYARWMINIFSHLALKIWVRSIYTVLCLSYSSKFSWQCFREFVIKTSNHKKFSRNNLEQSAMGVGSPGTIIKIFITKLLITKITICVIFNIFTKFLDHENLELYGICQN